MARSRFFFISNAKVHKVAAALLLHPSTSTVTFLTSHVAVTGKGEAFIPIRQVARSLGSFAEVVATEAAPPGVVEGVAGTSDA